ncbi:respiratory supercomplex assembly factor RCF1, partial [Ascoidea rubescens DSM 1968]
KEEPLVTGGILLTCGAVTLAAKAVRNGNRAAAQKWFRYRVGFQAFTIVVLVAGGILYENKSKQTTRSREELLAEKAKIRERLWIEELEKRDLEIKQRQRRAEYVRAAKLEAAE